MSIPVVDCGNGIAAVAKPITDALKSVGGVWLRNHTVDMQQAEKTFEAGQRFFGQPADAKKPYARDSKHYVEGRSLMEGWVSGGDTWKFDPHNKAELYEAYLMIKWHSERTQFHDEDERAAEVHKTFYGEMGALSEQHLPVAEQVMKAVAGQLELPSDLLDSWLDVRHSGDNNTILRYNYYPPVERDLDATDTARLGAHKDYHFLALTMENVGGLQGRDNATGEWFDVPHIDNGILVVAGEQMELITAGNIEALEHRVVVPSSAEHRSRPRIGTSFFYMPDDGAMLRPLLQPKAGHKKAYSQEPVSARELVNRKLAESRYDA